jgi:IS5 family transposase
MSRGNFSQPSLADAFVMAYSRVGGFLEDIAKTFEWAAFDVLMGPLHSSSDGAPAYPPLTMFKIVLVQQWYGLSDPGAEEAVRDRLSFQRFCGIPLDQEMPDHSSIWRFRQRIEKLGLSEKLLAEVNRQLDARGLIVKRGTLVDATIIAAAVKPPSFEEGVISERDPDASFTVKTGETHFGYKAHLAVDEESGLVRQAEMTSADLHDSQRGEAMIRGDEAAYYADKAYDSQALRDKLGELGDRGQDRLQGQAQQAVGQLAGLVQQDGVAHSRWRRARERDDEELVWDGEGSLSRPGSQQLPPSIRRDGDEHEAGQASHRGAVSRRGEASVWKKQEARKWTAENAEHGAQQSAHLRCGLLPRSKNRTAANLNHFAKSSS